MNSIKNSNIKATSHALIFTCKLCGECCKDQWRIPVSSSKLEIYKQLSNDLKRPVLIKDNRGWKINKDSSKSCSLLTKTAHCILHQKKGLSELGDTCRSYPRYFVKTGHGIEAGLSYSCPAALEVLRDYPLELEKNGASISHYLPDSLLVLDLPSWYDQTEQEIIKIIEKSQNPDQLTEQLKLYLSDNPFESVSFLVSTDENQRILPLLDLLGELFQCINQSIKSEYVPILNGIKNLLDPNNHHNYNTHVYSTDDLWIVLRRYLKAIVYSKTVIPDLPDELPALIICVQELILILAHLIPDMNKSDQILISVRLVEKFIMHSNSFRRRLMSHLRDWYR